MITKVHIENFKCFKDFDIELGPFNVLIGPNDSGKTAFLDALRIAVPFTAEATMGRPQLEGETGISLGKEAIWRNDPANKILIDVRADDEHSGDPEVTRYIRVTSDAGELFQYDCVESSGSRESQALLDARTYAWVAQAIGRVAYYRFDPSALKAPSLLSDKPFVLSQTGQGLPTFLNDIWGGDRNAFISLENEFYGRFPEYQKLIIEPTKGKNTSQIGQGLRFQTRHGERLSADSISDGAVLSLAFLGLTFQPDPPSILLIEEPENGVHHGRLKQIVVMLRDHSEKKGVQIILTTHSPYLLDCVEPDEVRVFDKGKDGGVRAAKLSGHPEVADLKKHFMTGEIWTELDEADVVAKQGAAG